MQLGDWQLARTYIDIKYCNTNEMLYGYSSKILLCFIYSFIIFNNWFYRILLSLYFLKITIVMLKFTLINYSSIKKNIEALGLHIKSLDTETKTLLKATQTSFIRGGIIPGNSKTLWSAVKKQKILIYQHSLKTSKKCSSFCIKSGFLFV